MSFLIKRQLITNIHFIEGLQNIPWGDYHLSFIWDPTNSIEIQISGEGDWKQVVDSQNSEEELLKVIDKLSLQMQSHVELGWNVAIYESGSGSVRSFTYIVHESDEDMVGEKVDSNNVSSVTTWLSTKLSREEEWTLRWIRRGINARGSYESFFFFILACESIVNDLNVYPKCREGHEIKRGSCGHSVDPHPVINHTELKLIMGKRLHKKIYRNGLRHSFFHGRYVPEKEYANLLPSLYPNLIDFISKKYSLNLEKLKIPRRILGWSAGRMKLFFNTVKPDEAIPVDSPSIKELQEWWAHNFNSPVPLKYIRHERKLDKDR